jgi:hypothetical protein
LEEAWEWCFAGDAVKKFTKRRYRARIADANRRQSRRMSPENWARKYNNGQVSAPVHIAIRILVLIFPLIFFVGMLAAIAIPAYQGYLNKARAARSSVQIEAPRHAGTVAMRATIVVPASAA